MSDEQKWAAMDIRYWYRLHEVCPHCGAEFKGMPPEANIYPHFTGACKSGEPKP